MKSQKAMKIEKAELDDLVARVGTIADPHAKIIATEAVLALMRARTRHMEEALEYRQWVSNKLIKALLDRRSAEAKKVRKRA